MKTIGILGGSKFSKNTPYYNIAQDIGKFLNENNYNIICGGGRGLMSAVASSYINNPEKCGRVCLLSDEYSDDDNYKFDNVGTKISVNSLDEQAITIFNNSDLCIFFPGGTGTIHEFVKFLTHDFHYNKKMILLGSYYENLYDMIINHNKYSSLIDEKITSNYDKYINKTIFFSNDTLINDKCLLREYLNFVFTS